MSGQVARRPRGTIGRTTKVTTNMFPLHLSTEQVIYMYTVEIVPQLSATAHRRNYELIDIMQTRTHPHAFPSRGAYDGSKILLASEPYPWGQSQDFQVLTSKRNPPPPPGEKGHFIIKLRAGRSFSIASLTDYIRAPTGAIPPDDVVSYINVFLRMAAMQNHAFRGNNFYVKDGGKVFSDWLMLRRGFFQSVRATVTGPLLNMDITSTMMWLPRRLSETAMSILNLKDEIQLSRLNDRDVHALRHLLKGIRVVPTHRRGAGPKAIVSFDRRGADQIRLEDTDQTIQDYFAQKYNIHLRYPKALCVSLSRQHQDLVPIELLGIDHNQFFDLKKYKNKQWERQIRDFAMPSPAQRLQITCSGSDVLKHAESDYMRRAGIQVDPKPLGLNARILPAVPLYYNNNEMVTPRPGAGSWRNRKFCQPMTVDIWAVLILETSISAPEVKNFIGQLTTTMEQCGMVVKDHTPMLYPRDARDNTIMQMMKRVQIDMESRYGRQAPSMLLVVDNAESPNYAEMKRWGDVLNGIPTQFVAIQKITQLKGNDYHENVALKINVKLGGVNFVPHSDPISWVRNGEPLMVIGADTSHPRPGEGWKPTIAAISFSVDQNVSKYNGVVTIQRGRQEIIANLGTMIRNAIMSFKARNKVAPKRIIYYRDGVGDGQLTQVVRDECDIIRKAFGEMKESAPRVTAIVVTKGHHVRFYPERPDADVKGNALPGLVIDTTITSPIHDDFYLLAHAGIIGTSRPMHAIPILDDNHLTLDQLEGLTFVLTHNFQRATRSVSIPAPIYYADILCDPKRARIHFDPSVEYGSDSATASEDHPTGQQYVAAFAAQHPAVREKMFWM